jgi:hypothetical protein
MGANRMSFGSDLVGCFKTFNRIKPKMYMTWLGPDGVHGMVQQQQMRCHGCKPHEFRLRFVGCFETFDSFSQKDKMTQNGQQKTLA